MRMHRPHGSPLRGWRRIAVAGIPAILLLACNSVRLAQIPVARSGDWPMFAMTAEHVPALTMHLPPPLTLEWDQDVQAGIGSGTPVLVDSILFIGNLRGDLQALHVRTGKKIGSATFGDAIQGSPVIVGRTAYLAFSNTRESLVAFDLVEGKPAWRRSYGELEVSPLLFNHKLYIGNLEGTLYCIEPATGDSVWTFSLPDNQHLKGIRSSPAGFSSLVVFGADNGGVYALDTDSGSVRWKFEAGAPVLAAPTIISGRVYIASLNGTLSCLDLRTGSLRWRFAAGSALYGPAASAGDLVVIGSTAGMLFALRPDDGQQMWKADLGGPMNTMALQVGDVLYVGTLNRQLIALSPSDGKEIWRTELPGRVKTSLAAGYGRLFVATDEKDVLSFRSTAQ